MNSLPEHSIQVAVVGEVLFDHFPDGKKVLGGAPFNVAWNLQGLGVTPMFLSAVGDDPDGARILELMRAWSLSDTGIQVHKSSSTGEVAVTMTDGEPQYEITLDAAYDSLSFEHSLSVLKELSPKILYHGSLCFRTKSNRDYFSKLVAATTIDRFVDLNLREPWVDRDWIPQIIKSCSWLKLNSDELGWLSRLSIDGSSKTSVCEAVEALSAMQDSVTQRSYLITCGQHGAYWIDRENCFHARTPQPHPFVDTVGAGDAFSSAAIRGIVRNDPAEVVLNDAVKFASRACTIQGATTIDPSHYRMAMY